MQKKHSKVSIKAATRASKYAVSPTRDRWASDVIVDLMHMYDLPHASLNPGASYRGLHDSIVNYGQNRPTMMLCQHEETGPPPRNRNPIGTKFGRCWTTR